MSEMIERIQRAMAPMIQASRPIHDYNSHAMVRAALEAMREPTEEQYAALSALGLRWRELNSTTVWQTYIDAALK